MEDTLNVTDIKVCRSLAYVVRLPSSSYITNSIVSCAVNAVFAIAGTFLNALVVLVFWKSPKLKNKIAYFLIMLLSLTDLGVSSIVHSLYLLHSVNEITKTANCLFKLAYQTSQIVLSGQSALTLFTINIERYLSIVHPVFHRNRVTKGKCVVAVAIFAVIPMIIAITLHFGLNIQVFITAITTAVCFGSGFVYTSIFLTARRRLTLVGVEPRCSNAHNFEEARQRKLSNGRRSTVTFLRDLKVAKTAFLVVACCFACYLPNGIVLGIWTDQTTSLDEIVQAKVWTTSLVTINSTLNCLIYFWANREFRHEWKKMIKLEL